jgi:transposase
MANEISMTTIEAIRALRERGYSKRKIARELGIHRKTVNRHLGSPPESCGSVEGPEVPGTGQGEPGEDRSADPGDPKCTISTPGSEGDFAVDDAPESGELKAVLEGEPEADADGQGASIGGSEAGRQSHCEPYREIIESKLEAQLHGKRIWQDLVDDHGFAHSYQSVKRFVAKLKQSDPQRVWRMECLPGEEVQVDYGTLWVEVGGKKKKIHLLRLVLSHSRKGYTEAMPRQDAESFIRGIENGFRHFGGVPQLLVLDNLKAGVLKPGLYDPELNPKFASFCEHYNITALPTRPYRPEHKELIA